MIFPIVSGTICYQQDLSVHESAQGAEWEKRSSEFQESFSGCSRTKGQSPGTDGL